MEGEAKNVNIKELAEVREYFSHNIRTSTAMVVATVMVFKYGLSEEEDSGSDIISESAYFLDIYDKGMDICFDFVLGKGISSRCEEIFPSRIIRHFQGKLPITIKEQGIDIETDMDDFCIKSNGYNVKSLLEIILCQEIRNAKGKMKISGQNGLYQIYNEIPIGSPPEIYNIFKRLLSMLGAEFSFDNNGISLRFA